MFIGKRSRVEKGRGGVVISLFLMLFITAGMAHADNRFGDGVGGAMGDDGGTFGQGSVTVHHNLIPDEKKELEDEIDALRDALRVAETKLRDEMAKIKPLTCVHNGSHWAPRTERVSTSTRQANCLCGGRMQVTDTHRHVCLSDGVTASWNTNTTQGRCSNCVANDGGGHI